VLIFLSKIGEKTISRPGQPDTVTGFGIKRRQAAFTDRYGATVRLTRRPGCRIVINSAWPKELP
jgi:hypothetical protein